MTKLRTAVVGLLALTTAMHAQQSPGGLPLNNSLSYQSQNVHASSTRNNFNAADAFDGDFSSAWQSNAALPSNYISNSRQNLLASTGSFSATSSSTNFQEVFDGDLRTSAKIHKAGPDCYVQISFKQAQYIDRLSVKFAGSDDLLFNITDANGNKQVKGPLSPSQSYSLEEIIIGGQVSDIKIYATSDFDLFEVAALGQYLCEDLVVDLEKQATIDSVCTRLLPHKNLDSVVVAVSNDSLNWSRIGQADISGYDMSTLSLTTPVQGRYIRYRNYVKKAHWASATISESAIFGSDSATTVPAGGFDPHAGLSNNHHLISRVSASSEDASHPKENIIDEDFKTSWEPVAPLPRAYVNNPRHNVLLGAKFTNTSPSGLGSLAAITDGDVSSTATISTSKKVYLEMEFSKPVYLSKISFSGITDNTEQGIEIIAVNMSNSWKKAIEYSKADNYKTKDGVIEDLIQKIIIRTEGDFKANELSAVGQTLSEDIVVDLASAKSVGYISMSYNGPSDVDSVRYYTSLDSVNWDYQLSFVPNVYQEVVHTLPQPTQARYVMARAYIIKQDFKAAALSEMKVYDKEGVYGTLQPATPNQRTLSDIMGINGIWGWGNGQYSDLIDTTVGQHLFSKVASHARNYQNMWWDVDDPDETPGYHDMSLAMWWLDWDREYQAWADAGLDVNVTLQFMRWKFPEHKWDSVEQASYNYGYTFARHFGPTYGNGLVKLFEIGNEPWAYPAEFYRKVLYHMARGVKDADPALPTFTCALQAHSKEATKHYAGIHMDAASAQLVDGLNIHTYSFMYDPELQKRVATYPENPMSGMRAVVNAVKFRDKNMPGKKLIVSEWGWDSDGYGLNCNHGECVSAKAQADYAVRGLLYLDRMGVDQATWFFYGDTPADNGLFSRSGLTGGNNNTPIKRSFKTWHGLRHTIGDYYFQDAVKEDRDGWVYQYGDAQGNPAYLVAWLPIDADDLRSENVSISYPFEADSTFVLDGSNMMPSHISNPGYSNGKMHLSLSATPIIIKLKNSNVVKKNTVAPQALVQSKEETLQMEAFPNPSNGHFSLSLDNSEGTLSYEVYDLAGKLMRKITDIQLTAGDQLSVNLSDLQSGHYILKAEVENEGNVKSKQLKVVIH